MMLKSSYATVSTPARGVWEAPELSSALPRNSAPASPSIFGRRASNRAEALAVRRSSEANAASASGDAIDRALMEGIVARDPGAFTALAERHAAVALGLAQRIVRNAADAEDVVQESLARLWMFADRWNPDTARFSSWFYRIVTNQAISRIRKKTTEPIDAVEEPSDNTPGPDDQLAGREIGAAIKLAIARLPDRQRAAIALCYDQGMSCAEAAEAMGVSIGTMESLLFRARRSLREWLGPLASDGPEASGSQASGPQANGEESQGRGRVT